MANAPTSSTPRHLLRDHAPIFKWIGALDDGIYRAEKLFVTTSLLLMSGVVFLDIYFRFLTSVRGTWLLVDAGDKAATALWPIPAVALAFVGIFQAIYRSAPSMKGNATMSWIATGLSTLVAAVVSWMMLTWSSQTVCLLFSGFVTLGLVLRMWDRPYPIADPPSALGKAMPIVVALVFGVGLVWGASTVPEGYTWSQKFALFLLLWMAFIGASMATHEGKHLTVDAVRKAVPDKHIHVYNALSYLVSAVFTVAFLWVGWQYFQGRLEQQTPPGEIPDWAKVLSIPVSFGLITIRFAGKAVAEALIAALKLDTEEAS